jgi:hypothetical protein
VILASQVPTTGSNALWPALGVATCSHFSIMAFSSAAARSAEALVASAGFFPRRPDERFYTINIAEWCKD